MAALGGIRINSKLAAEAGDEKGSSLLAKHLQNSQVGFDAQGAFTQVDPDTQDIIIQGLEFAQAAISQGRSAAEVPGMVISFQESLASGKFKAKELASRLKPISETIKSNAEVENKFDLGTGLRDVPGKATLLSSLDDITRQDIMAEATRLAEGDTEFLKLLETSGEIISADPDGLIVLRVGEEQVTLRIGGR